MAQTANTTRQKATRANSSSNRTSSSSKRGSKKSSSTSARSKPRSNAQSRNGTGSGAAHVISEAASKARTPALAAGAGLAGLAGGLALAHSTKRKRILGVQMPNGGTARAVSKNLAEAAKNVGSFGEGMGSLAAEVRQVREGVATTGEPKRSPIEVVLQGLTRRR